VLVLWLLAGCANIIDLEDRKVGNPGADAGAGAMSTPACLNYCTQARSLCTAANMGELFMTDEGCFGTCQAYAPGDLANPAGNTLACRMDHLAKVASVGEPAGSCPSAGPGGGAGSGGGTSCGSNCEGYCALYASVCGAPIPDCMTKCPALKDEGSFNLTADYLSGLDTLQCRLAHLTAAAAAKYKNDLVTTATHCSHSGLKSSVQCDVNDPKLIECGDFCKITNTACTGASQVYETDAQCIATCKLLPSGMLAETIANNVRCRRENAYKAFTTANPGDVPAACSNAGPAPALCGNGKCESYCQLAKAACPDGFKANFNDDLTACQTACHLLADSNQAVLYSTAPGSTGPGTLQCRILRVERVLGGDAQPATCAAAFGGGDCK
jgi:hypothetical protein